MAKNEPDPEVGSSSQRLLPMAKDQPGNDDIIELGSQRWRLLPMASGEEDEVGKSRGGGCCPWPREAGSCK